MLFVWLFLTINVNVKILFKAILNCKLIDKTLLRFKP